jgi:hypothetical protein
VRIVGDDVDAYHAAVVQTGAEVIQPPADRPWGVREMLVRDPNAHVIRFGHGIPMRVPKLEIERIGIEARLEKRLAAMAHDLAVRKGMSLGEMLEEMLLHSFEPMPGGGVASPHDRHTLARLPELNKTQVRGPRRSPFQNGLSPFENAPPLHPKNSATSVSFVLLDV